LQKKLNDDMLEQELQLEKDLFFFMNGSDSVFWDHFFYLYSYKWTWVPFYLCFFILFISKKNWKEWLCLLLATGLLVLLCDQISSGLCKPFFHRFRPTHHPDFETQVKTVLDYRGGLYGFISGHAANAFGFAVFTALVFRNRIFTFMIFTFAIITSYSRIYLGVHFISDVIAGTLAGIITGWFVYTLYIFSRQKWIQIEKEKLKTPIFSNRESYFLCCIYCLSLLILLVFNNQIITNFFQN
jgi:undecaprenyl-diphosphatase